MRPRGISSGPYLPSAAGGRHGWEMGGQQCGQSMLSVACAGVGGRRGGKSDPDPDDSRKAGQEREGERQRVVVKPRNQTPGSSCSSPRPP